MQIKVKELVGENAMTKADGEKVYSLIHDPLIEGQTVELDFEGVEVFASPFFNAGVGRLYADLQSDALNAGLKINHLSSFGQRVLHRVLDNAKEYYLASPAHRQAIDRIVQDTASAM